MPIDILMPQLSPTMTEGRLAGWIKKEGDTVSAGDVIAEVETDKATMEVEATDDGTLHKIMGVPGADILVGTPIAILASDGEDVPADYEPTSQAAQPVEETSAESTSETADKPQTATPIAAPVAAASPIALPTINTQGAKASVQTAAQSGARVKASPLARRLAAEKGVDLAQVAGTGPKGRIIAKDVENAPTGGFGGGARTVVRRADEVEMLTPMRKAIAGRLTASKQQVPHFYLNADVRMDAVMDIRKQLNAFAAKDVEKPRFKLTVNDFIVKACAMALADYPEANAAWNVDSVVKFGNVDISVAVSIDGGLITPIVANADQKSLVQISSEVKQLAADARAGKLQPEQYEGGSFSLSNLGMYGVKNFQAIINPPQAAILACGAAKKQPVVDFDGTMSVAAVMGVGLSVDHRVVDGALGAELLGAIQFYLENPAVLVG